MKQQTLPRTLKDYPKRTATQIRYFDLDRQGHVNNAVFATFSEIGRVDFFYDPANPLAPRGASFVVARLLIDYHAELFWPGSVEIGTGVLRIGRSSFMLRQGMFSNDQLVATVEATIVMIDEETRRSAPLKAQTRAILRDLILTDILPR